MSALGMHCFLAVAQGSTKEGKLVLMEYRGKSEFSSNAGTTEQTTSNAKVSGLKALADKLPTKKSAKNASKTAESKRATVADQASARDAGVTGDCRPGAQYVPCSQTRPPSPWLWSSPPVPPLEADPSGEGLTQKNPCTRANKVSTPFSCGASSSPAWAHPSAGEKSASSSPHRQSFSGRGAPEVAIAAAAAAEAAAAEAAGGALPPSPLALPPPPAVVATWYGRESRTPPRRSSTSGAAEERKAAFTAYERMCRASLNGADAALRRTWARSAITTRL